MVQLKNQRPGVKKEIDYSTDCLQQLKKFLAEPPDGLCIYHDKVVCEPKEVRIPFSVSGTHEVFQDCGLSAFLLDFTKKTNRDAECANDSRVRFLCLLRVVLGVHPVASPVQVHTSNTARIMLLLSFSAWSSPGLHAFS